MKNLVISKEQSTTLKLDPSVVEEKYLIRVGSSFEAYTGKNMRLWVDYIERREKLSEKVTEMQMAKELAKELGYENPKRVTIDIKLSSYWEDSDDGIPGHDILRTRVSSIIMTVVE